MKVEQPGDLFAVTEIHGPADDLMQEIDRARRFGLKVQAALITIDKPASQWGRDMRLGMVRKGDDTSARAEFNRSMAQIPTDSISQIDGLIKTLKGLTR
jgi:hypothetical protein